MRMKDFIISKWLWEEFEQLRNDTRCEKIKMNSKSYYWKNKDKVLKYIREHEDDLKKYRERNKSKISEYKRSYYKKHYVSKKDSERAKTLAERNESIYALYLYKVKQKEIAENYWITHQAVSLIIKKQKLLNNN